jgi:MFS family permease
VTTSNLPVRVEATLATNGLPVVDTRRRLSRRAGFWTVAASLAAMTAFSTAPSALYGSYARQDHLSSIAITSVYGVYAAGILVSLILVGHVSDWYGRRIILIPAIVTAQVASVVFTYSSALAALVAGRVLTGLALGAAVATATAYLTDLDGAPGAAATRRSQIVATVANVGGLAVGPLIGGLVAVHLGPDPWVVFTVFSALLALAVVGTVLAPEGRPAPRLHPRYHPQRLTIPSAARAEFAAALTGDFLVFGVFGVFAGLASGFLDGTLHGPRRSSPVWPCSSRSGSERSPRCSPWRGGCVRCWALAFLSSSSGWLGSWRRRGSGRRAWPCS